MEDQIVGIVSSIKSLWPMAGYLVAGLSTAIVLGRLYIKATPTQADDQWLQRMEARPVVGIVLRVLGAFSPVARAEAAPKKKKR